MGYSGIYIDDENPGYRKCDVGIRNKTDKAVLLYLFSEHDMPDGTVFQSQSLEWFPIKAILEEDQDIITDATPYPRYEERNCWTGELRINGFFLKEKGWI